MLRLHFIFKFLAKAFKVLFVALWAVFVFFFAYNNASAETLQNKHLTSNYTAGGTIANSYNFEVQCPNGYKIKAISIPVDASTGTVVGGLKIDNVGVHTQSITSSANYLVSTALNYILPTPIACEDTPLFTLYRVSGAGNLLASGVVTSNTGAFGGQSTVIALSTTTSSYLTTVVTTQFETVVELAPALPDDYNESMPPYKFATTSCETVGSSTLCTMAYKPEFSYYDIMFVLGLFFFIWVVFKK